MLLQGKIILPCLALGISSFVMVSTESILSVSFTSSLSRYGGDVAVGAMTVLTSVNQLITMPLQGICQGGQPLISYNYGAKKLERVKEAFFCQFLADRAKFCVQGGVNNALQFCGTNACRASSGAAGSLLHR